MSMKEYLLDSLIKPTGKSERNFNLLDMLPTLNLET